MPYFYVNRCKPPHPFASSYAVAGVMDAPDLETAKANIAEMLKDIIAAGLDSLDAYQVQALDDCARNEQGAVVWTFASND
jgi:hypothetical protein